MQMLRRRVRRATRYILLATRLAQKEITMIMRTTIGLAVFSLWNIVGRAETGPASASENGAVMLYTNGGWSFGLPAVRAAVSVAGAGTAISPEKKTLPALGIGVGVRAWRFLAPFAELVVIDT